MNENCDPIELGAVRSIRQRRLLERVVEPRVKGRLFRVVSDYSHVAGLITRCRDFHRAGVGLGRICTAFVPRPNNSAH